MAPSQSHVTSLPQSGCLRLHLASPVEEDRVSISLTVQKSGTRERSSAATAASSALPWPSANRQIRQRGIGEEEEEEVQIHGAGGAKGCLEPQAAAAMALPPSSHHGATPSASYYRYVTIICPPLSAPSFIRARGAEVVEGLKLPQPWRCPLPSPWCWLLLLRLSTLPAPW
uniref:Uncharacterized protein n=1 Tax=Oryza punctata TaxID=4537 RepID=A0A0E0KG38_ORYPU